MKLSKIVKRYRVGHAPKFKLSDIDPADTCGLDFDKDDAREMLAQSTQRLSDLQELLYAQDQWAILLVFQAMDAAGKDGVIKHVMSGVNPQGCEVHAFKVPTSLELDHDFLWRTTACLPQRGMIGVFNRSYYEEVLIVRVHPEILRGQAVPEGQLDGDTIWRHRYDSILDQEKHLHRNGTKIVKFFLHISKEEQRKRFLQRIDEPDKNWKFNEADLKEREFWKEYMRAYEQCMSATSTREAPWYIVPGDDKENARLIASQIVLTTLRALDPQFPETTAERVMELQAFRKKLVKNE